MVVFIIRGGGSGRRYTPTEKRATTPLSSSCSVRRFCAALCLFPFSRRSPASSKACFTKVVSSLSGQRCVVRYLLRSSDFCCVHGTRAHISKQAHTRFELAYQGPSLYIHYHWRQLRLNSCQAACCLRGLVLFCFAWDSLASVKVSLSNTKRAVMQR